MLSIILKDLLQIQLPSQNLLILSSEYHLFSLWSLPQFFLMFVYFSERACKWGRFRERRRKNPKQSPHWQETEWRGDQTHEMWDHDVSWSQMLNQLSHQVSPPHHNNLSVALLTFIFISYYMYLQIWPYYGQLIWDQYFSLTFRILQVSGTW